MTESASVFLPPRSRTLGLKICGLWDPHQAAAIAALGVDAIGVVAVPGSPRFLPLEFRSEVFAAARRAHPGIQGVLVKADPGDLEVATLLPGNGHDVVQLHGSESVERCHWLRRRLGPEVALWKALRIRTQDDLLRCQNYAGVVDALLLDAYVPDQLGGTGRSIPLHWLAGFTAPLPWWLAGGINPESVGEALQALQPDGVDASSGVEERPGWKDLGRVRHLVDQVNVWRPRD